MYVAKYNAIMDLHFQKQSLVRTIDGDFATDLRLNIFH